MYINVSFRTISYNASIDFKYTFTFFCIDQTLALTSLSFCWKQKLEFGDIYRTKMCFVRVYFIYNLWSLSWIHQACFTHCTTVISTHTVNYTIILMYRNFTSWCLTSTYNLLWFQASFHIIQHLKMNTMHWSSVGQTTGE